jgi:hypothetical protein
MLPREHPRGNSIYLAFLGKDKTTQRRSLGWFYQETGDLASLIKKGEAKILKLSRFESLFSYSADWESLPLFQHPTCETAVV